MSQWLGDGRPRYSECRQGDQKTTWRWKISSWSFWKFQARKWLHKDEGWVEKIRIEEKSAEETWQWQHWVGYLPRRTCCRTTWFIGLPLSGIERIWRWGPASCPTGERTAKPSWMLNLGLRRDPPIYWNIDDIPWYLTHDTRGEQCSCSSFQTQVAKVTTVLQDCPNFLYPFRSLLVLQLLQLFVWSRAGKSESEPYFSCWDICLQASYLWATLQIEMTSSLKHLQDMIDDSNCPT